MVSAIITISRISQSRVSTPAAIAGLHFTDECASLRWFGDPRSRRAPPGRIVLDRRFEFSAMSVVDEARHVRSTEAFGQAREELLNAILG